MRALLLDLYDTIAAIDWPLLAGRMSAGLGISADALFAALMQTRHARSVGAYGDYAGDLGALANACGVTVERETLHALADEMIALSKRHVRLYDDVLPALRALRAEGVKTAIVSNCDHVTTAVVASLGLPEEVDAIVLSCELGRCKPDPAIFEAALARLQVAASETGFVDDVATYLDAAAALGLRTFHLLRTAEARRDHRAGHAVVADLTGIQLQP